MIYVYILIIESDGPCLLWSEKWTTNILQEDVCLVSKWISEFNVEKISVYGCLLLLRLFSGGAIFSAPLPLPAPLATRQSVVALLALASMLSVASSFSPMVMRVQMAPDRYDSRCYDVYWFMIKRLNNWQCSRGQRSADILGGFARLLL